MVRPSFSSRLIGSIVSVGLAALTGYLLFGNVALDRKFDKMSQSCLKSPNLYALLSINDKNGFGNVTTSFPTFFKTKIEPFDRGLCFMTVFFSRALQITTGEFIGHFIIVSLGIPILAFLAIESTRSTSRFFSAWFSATFLLSQLIGVSVIIPLLWIPSYWLFGGKALGTFSHNRVYLMASSCWIIGIGLYPLALPGFSKSAAFPVFMLIFNFILPFTSLLWKIIPINYCGGDRPAGSMPGQSGSLAAISVFNFFAGISAALHSLLVLQYHSQIKSILIESYKILLNPSINGGVNFLLIDAISLIITILGFVAVEGGLWQILITIGKSFVFGPGCAFLLFASWREKRVFESSKSKMD